MMKASAELVFLVRPLFLACTLPHSCCVLTQPFLCGQEAISFSFYKEPSPIESLKAISPNIVTLGVRFPTCEFEGWGHKLFHKTN